MTTDGRKTAVCLLQPNLKIISTIMIAYIPKATVQAAIGTIPLSMGLSRGQTVLTAVVLSILIAAPIGAFLIDLFHKNTDELNILRMRFSFDESPNRLIFELMISAIFCRGIISFFVICGKNLYVQSFGHPITNRGVPRGNHVKAGLHFSLFVIGCQTDHEKKN